MASGRGRLVWRFGILLLLAGMPACQTSSQQEVTLGTSPAGTSPAGTSSTTSASGRDGVPAAASTTVPASAPASLPTTTRVPDCVGLADASSGDNSIEINGVLRTYRLSVPTEYDGTRATALIVNFHGFGSSAKQHETNTSVAKQATRRGMIVVTPDAAAGSTAWNVRADPARVDDFAFVHGLLTVLESILCIDQNRIFAAGHGQGAAFAAAVACSAPYEFAAVAMVSRVTPDSCPDEVTPAVIAIAGTADEADWYDNGDGEGVVAATASWDAQAGCSAEPVVTEIVTDVQSTKFGCRSAVVLLTIIGGAKPWPGGPVASNLEANSDAGRTFDATAAILDFFEAHGRAG